MPTILLIEDDPDLVNLYELWLGDDFSIRTADSADTALELLDPNVDCAIVDRRLTEGSGDDFLNAIEEEGLDCPAGIVSAVEPDIDILELRAEQYLVKPVSQADLTGLVDRLLAVDSYDQEVREYYRLASSKATLESTRPREELVESTRYQALLDDLAAAEARATRKLDSEAELWDFGG